MIGNSNFYPEALRRFATDYIASVRQGGSVGKKGEGGLGSLIRVMNRLADSDPDNYPRANPQNQLAIQAAGGGGPTIMTRAAMQREQGRADNQAFNDELQAAVNADTSIDPQTKALVLAGLIQARKSLGSNPVEAVEAIYLDVATRAKNPQYADQYIMPYVERVTAQQQQQAATEQPAATEAPSSPGPINRMAGPDFGSPALATNDVFNIGDDYAITNLDIRPSPDQVAAMRDGSFKPETKRSLVEAAQLLQDHYEASTGSNQPLDLSEDNIERIASLMATEAAFNLDQDGNAIGWYDRKLKAAKAVVTLVEPRVMQSPEAEQAFDFALAVTSNGQAVADNFAYALEVFRQFMDTGVMPTTTFKKGGERNTSMVAAFDFFNRWNESGQNETIGDFLNTDFTVRELTDFIARFNEANGTEISVPSSEGMAENVKASYILGPKIGQGFYQNIRGNYDPLTMDIWWMRMWNRLVGRPFEDPKTEEVMQKNRDKIERGMKDTSDQAMKKVINDALKAAGVNRTGLYKDPAKFDQFITQLNKTYQKFYKNYKAENGVNHTKPALFKAVGTHIKNMSEQLQAQPKGPGERSYMRKATKRAIELLQEQGYDINTADFQALMWYPEKQLFRLLGVAPGRGADNDYLDAAKLLAEKEGKSYDQIQEALPAAERDGINPEPGSPGQDGVIRQRDGGVDAAEEGVTYNRGPNIPPPGTNNGRRSEPGTVYQTSIAGSRPATPTESKAQQEPVKALFEIGKKGSPYEFGIKDMAEARKLAKALFHSLTLYKDKKSFEEALGGPAGSTRAFRMPDGDGPGQGGQIAVLDTGDALQNLFLALHEVGHPLEADYSPAYARSEPMVERNYYTSPNDGLERRGEIDTSDGLNGGFKTYRGTIRDFVATLQDGAAAFRSGRIKDKDTKQADAIIEEITNFQRFYKVGGTVPVREGYSEAQQAVSEGALTLSEAQDSITDYENEYLHMPYEMAADVIAAYLFDPRMAKREMPKTTAVLQVLFEGNPTVQLFSLPFASVLAVIMANMLIAEREEEEKKMPSPGALSLGQAPGALSI